MSEEWIILYKTPEGMCMTDRILGDERSAQAHKRWMEESSREVLACCTLEEFTAYVSCALNTPVPTPA